jgi:hypothetical protein
VEIICPACGKTNELAASACPRCGCDLGQLALITRAAAGHLRAAARALRAGEWMVAIGHAEKSWSLRHSSAAARLAGLAAAALGDAPRLLRWWKYQSRNGPHRC